MRETPEDIEQLQGLLTRSIERAGDFLRSSFQMPAHSLSASQIATHMQGIRNLAFATTTAAGEPRVAPIGSILYRAAFYIPSVATAARTRQAARNPAVSLTYFESGDFAIIVHGRAAVCRPGADEYERLAAVHRDLSGHDVMEWGEGVYLRVDPDVIYTFARYPERFGEGQ